MRTMSSLAAGISAFDVHIAPSNSANTEVLFITYTIESRLYRARVELVRFEVLFHN